MNVIYKILLFIFLCCVTVVSLSGQSILKGRVVDEITKAPLAYASVYFNSTTNGATTDNEGKFEIEVDANFLELVVSYLGYKTILHKLDIGDLERNFLFQLSPLSELIAEIEIRDKRGPIWYENLAHFKKLFIGESSLAGDTKIDNPEVLSFHYDEKTRLFEARARGPIHITNDALGYDVVYDLEHFSHDYNTQKVIFLGYSRFSERKGKKRKQKKWTKSRNKAYLGSSMHFMKSLHEKSVYEQGFRINKIVRTPNPDRPSDESRAKAREIVKLVGYNNVPDSIATIIKKSRAPKYFNYLDKNPYPYENDIKTETDHSILSFTDIWQVIYDKEKEDKFYTPPGKLRNPNRVLGLQTSTIVMTVESVEIIPIGLLKDPLAVLYEGYWAFEKMGDTLPLDYVPSE